MCASRREGAELRIPSVLTLIEIMAIVLVHCRVDHGPPFVAVRKAGWKCRLDVTLRILRSFICDVRELRAFLEAVVEAVFFFCCVDVPEG